MARLTHLAGIQSAPVASPSPAPAVVGRRRLPRRAATRHRPPPRQPRPPPRRCPARHPRPATRPRRTATTLARTTQRTPRPARRNPRRLPAAQTARLADATSAAVASPVPTQPTRAQNATARLAARAALDEHLDQRMRACTFAVVHPSVCARQVFSATRAASRVGVRRRCMSAARRRPGRARPPAATIRRRRAGASRPAASAWPARSSRRPDRLRDLRVRVHRRRAPGRRQRRRRRRGGDMSASAPRRFTAVNRSDGRGETYVRRHASARCTPAPGIAIAVCSAARVTVSSRRSSSPDPSAATRYAEPASTKYSSSSRTSVSCWDVPLTGSPL